MKITILYDNEALRPDLTAGWGFSCLISKGKESILFDTGWDGNVLVSNMEKLGINPRSVGKIFISHQHWDHMGGLPQVLSLNPGAEVFVTKSFSARLKAEMSKTAKVKEISGMQEICKDIFSTGEMGSEIKEQSLVAMCGKGAVLVTGCAHPGLGSIIEKCGKIGNLCAVVGGFHGFEDFKALESVSTIAPCHCTAKKNELAVARPDACVKCGVGKIIKI